MKSKGYNCFRVIFAHVLLVILSLMCLFFFYILLVNATRSHADLQRGFSALPGGHLLTNFQYSLVRELGLQSMLLAWQKALAKIFLLT